MAQLLGISKPADGASLDLAVENLRSSLRHRPHAARTYDNLTKQIGVKAGEQKRRGIDPCVDLGGTLDLLERLPRQPDFPPQAEAEDQLRALLASHC